MFDNVVLDVAIGLIFIFTLYSLLATTINEFISTILAYRPRMLERGLEQMLDGKNFSYYWWDKVANFFIWTWYYIKGKTKAAGLTTQKAFFAKQKIGNASSGKLVRRKLNDKAALFAALVTEHALYKRKAENSLLFKKPAYLDSTEFSDILLDLLHTDKQLPQLLRNVEASVLNHNQINADLKNILLLYIRQSNGDMQRFRYLLEKWYDDTMDRVSGWYKRQTQRVLLIIGMCLAAMFNVNTIEIVKKLSGDQTVRDAMVRNASAFVEKNLLEGEIDNDRNGNKNGDQPKQTTGYQDDEALIDSSGPQASGNEQLHDNDSAVMEDAKRKIEKIKALYNETISEQNMILSLGWGDFGFKQDSLQYVQDSIQYVKDSVAYSKSILQKENANNKNKPQKPEFPRPPGFFGKLIFILSQFPANLVGFLITAFAVSLGAPFWFDLLNKVVNLRSSGQRPADRRTTGVSPQVAVIQKPDPAAKG